MPGIDFQVLRARISILEVLRLLQFEPVRRRGERLRGPCPMHCTTDPRTFVADLATHRYYCHSCHRGGNQIELWAEAQGLTFYEAARDLCLRLNLEVPYIYRW